MHFVKKTFYHFSRKKHFWLDIQGKDEYAMYN